MHAPVGTGCQGASGAVTDTDRPSALSPEPRTVESLALLRAITSSATVGFGFVDCDCRIVRLNAMLAAIAEQTLKQREVVRRGDKQDRPQPRQHQRGERVVDHRLIIDGQQLFTYGRCRRVKASARPTGQNDAFHSVTILP